MQRETEPQPSRRQSSHGGEDRTDTSSRAALALRGMDAADAATAGRFRMRHRARPVSPARLAAGVGRRASHERLFRDPRPSRLVALGRRRDHRRPLRQAALYQQDPADASNAEWSPELFGDWIWVLPDRWPPEFIVSVVCVDASKGKSDRQGDYSAIVFLGLGKDKLIYVDAILDRIRRPSQCLRLLPAAGRSAHGLPLCRARRRAGRVGDVYSAAVTGLGEEQVSGRNRCQ